MSEVIETFIVKAQAVQAHVTRIKDMQEAFDYAAKLTAEAGGKAVAAPLLKDKDRKRLEKSCEASGLEVLSGHLRERIGTFYTGFSVADAGIAKTGTLLQESNDEDVRLATMLSEEHVAVVKAKDIVPDTAALGKKLTGLTGKPGSYTAFISGASRTADIERVLTLGVHGPLALHILILDEEAGE